MMALQKPLKTAIGLLTLAYNQAVTSLNTAEGGLLRPRHKYIPKTKTFFFSRYSPAEE
jgi:hypothetical protein